MTQNLSPLFTWRGAICDSGLAPTARHVALTLSLHMNERGGSCYPGTRTLADETGLNRDTVRRSLKVLEDSGWVRIDRPERQGRGQLTHYTATQPDGRRGENAPSEQERRGLSGEKARPVQPKDVREDVTSPNGDGLFEVFYHFWTGTKYVSGAQTTSSMRGRLNAAVKEARLAGIDKTEVYERGRKYRELWRGLEPSPQALLANWHRFAPDPVIPECGNCDSSGLVYIDASGIGTRADDPNATTAVRCPECAA